MTNNSDLKIIKKKVDDLLKQMSLEEKLAQLQSYWMYDLQTLGTLDNQKVESKLSLGIGQITRIAGASTYEPREAAKIANQLQRFLKENTRLGIPAIVHEECCVGLMAPGGSIFPEIIGLASTFRPDLAFKMTAEIRKQMMAIGSRQGLAPVLDVARDPRWGRVEETFGEDPLLVSQFGVEYIKGLQTDDLKNGVMATGKHFVGHSFSQGGLNCAPVQIGWRDLWDVYLAPFQAAIRDAGIASMMNAYPEIDGEVVAASKRILTDLLRNELGFDGLVVSDYEAIIMIHNYHNNAQTKKEAAIMALTAGIDVELPTVNCYDEELLGLVKSGELPVEIIDQSVGRHLQKKFELGLFDNPYVNEGKVIEVFDNPEQRKLAYEIASQSLVLLKNDGLLPLKPSGMKIALIGPNANSSRSMMGDYSYAAVTELLRVVPEENSSFQTLTAERMDELTVSVPTFLDAINEKLTGSEILYSEGCGINSEDESGFAKAVENAYASDVVVLVLGGRSGLAPNCTTGEFRDTTDLSLPGVQEKLAHLIIETGKPVVLVMINGRPASIPDLVDKTNAILQAWVPGEEGGRALVSALFGEVNPGGKLPISIPRSAGQIPVFYNHKPSGRRSNIYGDYVNEKVTPLFPFGHGLSYSEFKYTNFQVSSVEAKSGDIVDISCSITNTSSIAGEEVVQLYSRDLYASIPRPVKELKGFMRIGLEPGETKSIKFSLPIDMQAFYDINFELIVESGTIELMIGSSSEDIRLNGRIEIIGEQKTVIKNRIFVCPVEVIS
ncbi:MAG: glycoside hydrolase family 3 N-terminal domain-containing protein [Anaerolineaceae bacterium]|nr:glycoside hydrolase family 3 N-terminal domain-containing protein [Anaerolineaceae bacterium]